MKTAERAAERPRRRAALLSIGLLAWLAVLAYAGVCIALGEKDSAHGAVQLLLLGGWTGYVGWLFCRGRASDAGAGSATTSARTCRPPRSGPARP